MTIFLSAVILTWMVAAFVCAGLGTLLLRVAAKDLTDTSFGDRFWAGLAGTIGFLLVWNLFYRINPAAPLTLAGLGISGWILDWNLLRQQCCRIARAPRLELAGIFAFALAMAWAAAGECIHYDTGLYGASSIKWAIHYPAVPGLANLHSRLGFNSANFLCLAALDQGCWQNRSQHLFAPLLFAALGAQLLPAFIRVFQNPRHPHNDDQPDDQPVAQPDDFFRSMLLLPLLPFLSQSMANTDSDLPALCIALAAAAIVFRSLNQSTRSPGPTPTQSPISLAVAALLLAALVTMKLSAALFAVLMFGFALTAMLKSTSGQKRRRLLGAVLGITTVMICAWMTRGVILSGYPLYPARFLSVPVEWRATRSAVFDSTWVTSWARTPYTSPEQTRGFHWINGWLNRNLHNRQQILYPGFVFLMSLCVWLAAARRQSTLILNFFTRPNASMLIPAIAGLIFWFVMAPDPRFAGFDIWIIVAVTGTLSLRATAVVWPQLTRGIFILAILASIWSVSERFRPATVRFRNTNPAAVMPQGSVTPYQTRSGLVVNIPTQGDQCWAAPLPNTPYPDPDLQLRSPNDPAKGFTTRQR